MENIEDKKEEQVEKTYSQADVDSLMDKVRKTEAKKLSELETKLQGFEKSSKIKDEFLKAGGNLSAANDFIKANDFDMEKDLGEQMTAIKKQKSYFFQSESAQTVKATSTVKAITEDVKGKPRDKNVERVLANSAW